MFPIVAQGEEIQKLVDHAANQSDRWFFVATFAILVFFAGLVIRYLIKDREAARAEHAVQLKAAYEQASEARKEHAATMKECYGEQTKLAAQLLVALQENNELLQKIERIIDRKEGAH